MKCELIEKYLEPTTKDVVSLFFQYANICFPVFDEASFMNAYCTRKEEISPALLCNLYANSLIYWDNSPKLRLTRTTDIRYIWNQANEALHSELFLCPGISTVLAMLLNVCGRPSTSIFGNGGMVGTAVALSNALGLNRDPCHWNISTLEKGFRIRIWWLVVIQDRCLAYGTPLQVHRAQYDVPFPTMEYLCSSSARPSQEAAASIFIAFTTLTEVLGQYLEYIYHVSSPVRKTITSLSHLLTNWEGSLDINTRHIIHRGTDLSTPGAANLRLAYLSVKLLLRRIALDMDDEHTETSNFDNGNDSNCSSFSFTQVERTAEEIVHLVKELDEQQLRGFWVPVQAYSLTSATTFLLRSGLRRVKSHSANSDSNPPLDLAKEMVATLQSHRQQFGWDLGDDCLAKCADLVERVASLESDGMSLSLNEELSDPSHVLDIDTSILDEVFWDMPCMGNTLNL
ncbi:transcriptional regulator family: Fungal Specific TF [Aspergillus niger]|nr:transcriptional regulator family: Fungal Specific TF [Aspergillus niger]KAI2839364.1 transcriptional regulator family: Fungal Specific TF [Aspergillus niger]KAI2915894.1 transcriptional regulator family: Fungal Specific TF [Aspergillus niger]KAI2924327.1 transcriptional regulator family: Fungal Specific TF [Aspergillus niger]KAI2939358.1 transcriptional regulator family: Fungal Specific TF [Aspergillus niger]